MQTRHLAFFGLLAILLMIPAQGQNLTVDRLSWSEGLFQAGDRFEWTYTHISFNGVWQEICPCLDDLEEITILQDLDTINILENTTDLSNYFQWTHHYGNSSQSETDFSKLLELERFPLIYPVEITFPNGSLWNLLEFATSEMPRENRTDVFYVTREVTDDVYLQRVVYSDNPWYRFEVELHVPSGILLSLFIDEGFHSFVSPAGSHTLR
ncbi:MAG: hypothetical protein ACXAE3_14275, partial [Candidatus Kariarchaeaceae archaeon]